MNAAVFRGVGDLTLEQVSTPDAGPGELVVGVGANTVCGTDVRILRGEKTKGITPPIVLGHEFSGTVVDLGVGVSGYEIGDVVVVSPGIPCGRCVRCKRDMENLCPNIRILGYDVGGGMSDYVRIPADAVDRGCVFRVRKGIAFEHLALAEPLACCINGHTRSGTKPNDTVVVLGAGPIGIFHIQLSLLAGARDVIVSEPLGERRRIATGFGATHVVEPTALPDVIADVTNGEGADVCVVCIGIPSLVNDAIRLTRAGGTVNVFAGLAGAGWAEVEANAIHYKELNVTGTSNSRRRDFEVALDMISSGRIAVERMVTHRYGIEDALKAIETSASGAAIKVALMPSIRGKTSV